MNEPARNNGGAAVLGALAMVGAVPLGLLTLMVSIRPALSMRAGMAFGIEGFELFRDGGPFAIAVLISSLVATAAGAGMMHGTLKRDSLPGPAAVLPFLIVSLLALAGSKVSLGRVVNVLPIADAADRATIIAAAISELMSLQLFSLAFTFAGCACGALGLALGFLTSRDAVARQTSAVGALGLIALAGSLGFTLRAAAQTRIGFGAIAVVPGRDRYKVLLMMLEELQPNYTVAAAFTLAALGIAIVGTITLLKVDRRAAMAMGGSLLVAVVGFRGVIAVTDRVLSGVDLSGALAPEDERLLVFAGADLEYARSERLSQSPEKLDAFLHVVSESRSGAWAGIELERDDTRGVLTHFLQRAHLRKISVNLNGLRPPYELPPNPPAALKPFMQLFNQQRTGAPVRIRFEDERCDDCVGRATVIPSGLEAASANGAVEEWQPKLSEEQLDETTWKPLDTEWKGTPEALARGASAAVSRGFILVVVVPRPESEN